MSSFPSHPKITPDQLARRAIVYIRQSSERQVRFNKESQGLQYALAARARQLGWPDVEVIDCDLGASAAAGSAPRRGFDQLLGAVARGEVGIVLSREVSRLSRTDRDWCSLLEVCKLFGTVLADAEQVYDLHSMDDQLVLGIKGTMSVAELNILKMRCVAGQEAKAGRGALYRTLPPGYVLDLDGRPVKDPDARVQQAISLVFTRYRDLWSVRQTMRWFREHGIELPYNRREAGRSRIAWQLPTYGLIKDILHNPFYAGAYAYGRRTQRMVLEEGRVKKKQGPVLAAESCRVLLPGHHEGYIDWATYEEHRIRIRGSQLGSEGDATVTAVRAGHGLLAGLLRCGRCGRRMHVRYWGKSGTAARYLCRGDFSAGGWSSPELVDTIKST
jgi:DNA invertase Pin-like site-specific DNA recombinase